ncbi:hypothetical protein [Chelativorans sp. M5D2P16]|uniref:hypothetical protein n=1 Tax=Chelativorans sp. M5D2P16 TaxID=3095678 RepID=UPI002ACA2DD5|nr:hypothetical protein [Chelativorans sp. M5D2P16]MDZ5697931.1 hypothetical protein [Chelativorans sp. M5D2P16]
MIQTVLSFALGFLVAAILALSVAPALWRRAGIHMRRHMEASMPMSREELEAQVDALRAEHAMAMRRLEMKAEAIKQKAAQDLVEINLQREEIKRLEEACAERDETIGRMEADREALSERFSEREREIEALRARLAEDRQALKRQVEEVEELSRLYEEASLTSSSRQIELVAREADIERLQDANATLRAQRKEAERAMRDAVAEKGQLEEALRVERERAANLERKVERMMTNLSTRDERLERREREIARLKQKIRDGKGQTGPDGIPLAGIDEGREEAGAVELAADAPALLPQDHGLNGASGARTEIERLRSRLATLMRQNKKLRTEIAAGANTPDREGEEELREQISSLAAEVVNITAALEGPDSPIDQALSEDPPGGDDGVGAGPPSLAERVRALRRGSPAAE